MLRLLASAAIAAAMLCGTAVAQATSQYPPHRQDDGNWANYPITTDQAWDNGVYTYNEFRHNRYFDHYDTIEYKRGDPYPMLEPSEFREVFRDDFRSADRNGNGRIDNETERCLLHRTAEGRRAGGIGYSEGQINAAAARHAAWLSSLTTWNMDPNEISSGVWPRPEEDFYTQGGRDEGLTWDDIPGCAFMATAAATGPAAPTAPVTPQTPPVPVTPGVPVTPVQNAAAPCTRAPSQQEATRLVFTAWADGRLTAAEADGLNRGRHCQLDQNRDGQVSEAEFVAVSLADFDRADRNDDGVLSGQREIGAFASPGAPTEAGLTRQQANDIARLRFAVLDRQPRDSAVTLEEYLAVTAQEFARNDANGDGALTGQEALRQAPQQ